MSPAGSGAATPGEGRGWAPGKLILVGEHAVVYGHPAISLAIDRGTEAVARTRPGASGIDRSEVLGSDGILCPFPADPRLGPALATVLPPEGVGLSLRSTLPIGRGMGSSAALAVATLRALAALDGSSLDHETCISKGFLVERVFHGTPSGLDHTVSTRGGALCYRRGAQGLTVRPLQLAALRLVVLDSGVAGDTAQMVAGVASRRPQVDAALSRIGALVERVVALLDAPGAPALDILGEALTENHGLLREIGVSTPDLDALVGLALGAGALGAKLAGAGGGGVVVALVSEPEPLLRAAAAAGVTAFPVSLSPNQA